MKRTGYKNLISKWLFAVLLILNFFTLPGTFALTTTNTGKPQTTLITVSNLQLTKSIGYKRALKPVLPKYLSLFSFVNADYLHTQQVKVRIEELEDSFLPPQIFLFYIAKTIPQNTGDDPNSLIG